MYLFVSMFDSATALLFLFMYLHLDTISLYVKRMINTSTEKSAVNKGAMFASWKPEYVFPRGL